ncbi:MAG: SPOR domain-containing protein [Haliea sp.]|mgnify:CR=1 FL=1|jgi:cell division septation protein DedD|nr:SPOR domain-containing protein [Haliea sp.]
MARDQGGRSGARRKPQAARRNESSSAASPWRWYGAGVGTGVFLSLLLYLGTLPPSIPPGTGSPAAAEAQAPPKPRFDFYTLLPEQTIDVEVEPSAMTAPLPSASPQVTESFVLQAGSFRQREDADRRRAELLLLGLDPNVEESTGNNGRWFRVYLGPFSTHAQMSRARGLTAAQNIDTLLLKRGTP